MVKVLILSGGSSNEREVSLRSGGSVKIALEDCGYGVGVADPAAKDFDIAALSAEYDVVFSVLHGKGGEDGVMQAELEGADLAYVGTDAKASALTFDKRRYRQKLIAKGIEMPKGKIVDKQSFWQTPLCRDKFVLKPFDGGSSIDTVIVRRVGEVDAIQINDVFSRHTTMLIERLIEGIEITVPVLGEQALPVIEIIPPESGEFDYDNKYNGRTQELCPAVNVPANVQKQAQLLAEKLHDLCGCRDYSRSDMIVDSTGNITVLETNTLPGMTDQSLFPRAAKIAGINMPELCDRLVKMALSRRTGSA